jgi:uncharacterized protein
MSNRVEPTDSTKVKRYPNRARYDWDTINAILDATLLCHVAYQFAGRPYVTPTLFWRSNNTVYWHASSAGRMEKLAEKGADACFNVCLIDGLVLARSMFHHSVNYRSVTAFGRALPVKDDEVKKVALDGFMDRVHPGRSREARAPSKQELKATLVLSMQLDEISAKVRTGGPVDKDEDYEHPCWAGIVPLRIVAGEAIPDNRLVEGIGVPAYVQTPRLFART